MSAAARSDAVEDRMGSPVAVRRLVLSDFRSYPNLDLEITAQMVVVTGENGSGKTNLLEALSMLAQGRGLRRADLAACARVGGSGGFLRLGRVDGSDACVSSEPGWSLASAARRRCAGSGSIGSLSDPREPSPITCASSG